MQGVCSAACAASCWRARPAATHGTRIFTAKRIIIGKSKGNDLAFNLYVDIKEQAGKDLLLLCHRKYEAKIAASISCLLVDYLE